MDPMELGYKVVSTSQYPNLISKLTRPHLEEQRSYENARQMAFFFDRSVTWIVCL